MKYFFMQLKCDIEKNSNNIKIFILLICFRISHVSSVYRKKSLLSYPITVPILLLYRFVTEWILHLELPAATIIGKGLIIDHGYSLVVNKHTVIGDFCRLRHSVTIGCKTMSDGSQGPSPQIGNNVEIGVGAILIGDIVIGDNVKIGAGCVVTKNIPDNAIAIGNPAKVIPCT